MIDMCARYRLFSIGWVVSWLALGGFMSGWF